jgi:hypothetical protein
MGKHDKDPSDEQLQDKADEFDKQFQDSKDRVEEQGYPELPPNRDYQGRPVPESDQD